ncbi:HlyD family secretion protein [Elusimicrobium simillimum]|uniref:efflux RND transporter periplasmic adaptor subunit n=1 Tax=Elusimicrobium simillimum TaxID=3143438 RepID=UPI003C6EBB14
MKKIIAIVVVVLLILVAVALMFFRATPFKYSGVVEAVEVNVSSRLTQELVKNHFTEGDMVKKGDILAELDCNDINLALTIADKEYKRAAQLLKSSAGSQDNYDKAKHNYDDAVLKKSWCTLASPIDGKVLYKYFEEGELVSPGRKLYTVADMREMDVWVYVPHDVLSKLSVNMKLTAYLPEAAQNFDGYISVINDEAEFTPKNVQTRSERTRLVYGIKTKFKNDDKFTLKPGMTLEVNLPE